MDNQPVIEIIINSNHPNVGKTLIAARIAGMLKNEFGITTYTECSKLDFQEAIFEINEHGVPRLEGVIVLIRDEDQPLLPGTLQKLKDEIPHADIMRLLPGDPLPNEPVAPTEPPAGGHQA